MTNHSPHDAARAEQLVSDAMQSFELTRSALREAIDEIKAEARDGEREVVRQLKALNTAFQVTIQMEAKARDLVERNVHAIRDGEFDLAAARAEIGQRLARLRAAGDG